MSSNEAVSKEIYFYLSYTKSVHTYPRICAYAMSGADKRGCKQAGGRDRCCTLAGKTSRNVAYAYDPRWQRERMAREKEKGNKKIKKNKKEKE